MRFICDLRRKIDKPFPVWNVSCDNILCFTSCDCYNDQLGTSFSCEISKQVINNIPFCRNNRKFGVQEAYMSNLNHRKFVNNPNIDRCQNENHYRRKMLNTQSFNGKIVCLRICWMKIVQKNVCKQKRSI